MSRSLTDIEERYLTVGEIRGGIFLLRPTDAIRLIDECERLGIDVIGVEGLKLFGEKIQPFQEHSFDLCGKNEGCHAIAKTFISERTNLDLWFEVGVSGQTAK